jgi:hypothetical protein
MVEYNRNEKLSFYNERKLETGKTWILFLLLGWYYGSINKIGKQILFYLTLGGLGVWTLYLLFTLNGNIKKHNIHIAKQVGLRYFNVGFKLIV